ncbi:phosphoadenylyl-sulfate reductase [Rapidithrix thailandica]|uniref:Adenosine 5'-phosphosulfate reductase n=1 Tax=Rapidithrix thailandica TaxID=413964 RepID=A0AAW9S149_9BACT
MIDFAKEIDRIARQIEAFRQDCKSLFVSSSFQPQSATLLHIISQIDKNIPVYFLNTGYHFPETLAYKTQLADLFQLNVIDLHPLIAKSQQTDEYGNLLYTSDPDYCCHLNKVQPLEPVLQEKDVWINGIRKGQSQQRASMQEIEKAQFDVLRYHPLLEWDARMVHGYIAQNKLPHHPLLQKGYMSIGCQPCTRRVSGTVDFDNREGRWAGKQKTECGLHTNLIKKD